MALGTDPTCFPLHALVGEKPERAFFGRHRLASALRAALKGHTGDARPSFSLTEIVHFPHCRYPPNGGRPSPVGGPLIQPRSSHLASGTGTLPGNGRLPFLTTKIVPARFGGLVARPRLFAMMSELPTKRVGLVKAPA